MKEIYGICSGSYEDWTLDYMFESEEKRDIILKHLGDDYSKIDYNTSDNLADNIIEWYMVEMDEDDGGFVKYNSIQHKEPKDNYIFKEGKLKYMDLRISKEEFDKGWEYCEDKWRSEFNRCE